MTGRLGATFLPLVLAIGAACGGGPLAAQMSPPATSAPTQRTPTPVPPSAIPTAVPVLSDGPIPPGTYLFVHQNACDSPPIDCPAGATPPPRLGVQLTVPAGWVAATDAFMIRPADGREPGAPGNSALVMGWTSFHVGLNSEPCSQTSHQRTDIDVGPTVDDFVEAVRAHPGLDISDPTGVSLGGYQGRSFTLTGPPDLSGCEEWRPWDPGFFAQGPNNIWDVWVMSVDGFRILIVTQRFRETPPDVSAELRKIAESIRFVP